MTDEEIKLNAEAYAKKYAYIPEVFGVKVLDSDMFKASDFSKNVAKYVRANHVQTDKHWRETWTKNEF